MRGRHRRFLPEKVGRIGWRWSGRQELRVHDTALGSLRKKLYRGHEEVRLGEGKILRPERECGVAWSHRILEFLPAAMMNSGE
jgi:hypothetical protein